MDTISDVIAKWPTHAALADDLRTEPVRIRQFKAREWIPPEYWEEIIYAARRRQIAGVTYRLLARLARERAGREPPGPQKAAKAAATPETK